MRIQRLVERIAAEIFDLADRIGLADRVEDNAAFLGDVVDRQLHRGGKRADDEIDFLFFDQLERARRGFAGIQLVVAHEKFGLAPVQAAAFVELLDRDLGGSTCLRLGAERRRSSGPESRS